MTAIMVKVVTSKSKEKGMDLKGSSVTAMCCDSAAVNINTYDSSSIDDYIKYDSDIIYTIKGS